MPHHRQHVPDIAEICRLRGVVGVVISPGSRNAPLVDAFYRSFGDACLSVVDERSAAFVALGIARSRGGPVVLLCSSGTAVLNYAPALAEARYQEVPILAITADRPASWIDQQDNQTIRQAGVFDNFVKRSLTLPAATSSEDDLWFAQRAINEAVNECTEAPAGPVHVNVPLEEPLYAPLPPVSARLRLMPALRGIGGGKLAASLAEEWMEARSILVVHGQDRAPSPSAEPLLRLARDKRVAVIAEDIANVGGPGIVANPELLLARVDPPPPPDLLLYSGGHVVSKRLKAYLRPASLRGGWRTGYENGIVDTYQQTTKVLRTAPEELYEALAALSPRGGSDTSGIDADGTNADGTSADGYGAAWLDAQVRARRGRDALLPDLPFSDITAVGAVIAGLPDASVLELGNSSTIRNAQLFDPRRGIAVHSNRGVSGIDGSLSAAVGTALTTDRIVTCILGDLGFLYDSNALWNRALPPSLRVVVINNRGGAIFGLIGAPLERLPHRDFIEAHHPVRIEALAEAFGLRYFRAADRESLAALLPPFFGSGERAAMLEIEIPPEANPGVFRRLMGRESR